MKKLFLAVSILMFSAMAFAQDDGSTMEQPKRPPLELPWEQQSVGDFSDPVGYVHQSQANVMYYTTIWRIIDLREKRNHPLYFPIQTRGTWSSLAQVIFDAIDRANPERENALKVYSDEYCEVEMTPEELESAVVEYTTIEIYDPETQEIIGTEDQVDEFSSSSVMYYYIKEVWFFDNKRSVIDCRILQIQPIIEYVKEVNTAYNEGGMDDEEEVTGQKTKRPIGYIMWDELRPFLAQKEMFNPKNSAARISLDDAMTWKRLFSSFIIAEGNTYSDRQIQQYIKNTRDQRLESERIAEQLRTFESDVWQF